jgi:hypothetical protein
VYSTRTIGIIVSSAIAVVLVVIAVLISGPIPFFTKTVSAESTHELLVQYASKDSDADDLPDWEESLYGTDPNNPHSVNANVTDGVAVAQGLVTPKFASATSTPADLKDAPGVDTGPQTVTDQFAREFFAQYLSQHNGTRPTAEDIAQFVEDGVNALTESKARPDAYNMGQIRVSGTGPDALLAYAAAVEKIWTAHTPANWQNEVEYLDAGVNKGDTTAFKKMSANASIYTAIGREMMTLPVPKEVATGHLSLANAFARKGLSVADMVTYPTDPLRAMIGIAQYKKDEEVFTQSLTTLLGVFNAEQVIIERGTPGSHFYASLYYAAPVTP